MKYKHITMSLSVAAMLTTSVLAQHSRVDSVYLFSYATEKNQNHNGLHFAWSADKQHWNSIGNEYAFVKSDYGTWGPEKRMLEPVLDRMKDGTWRCSWLVNERDNVIAHTQTKDLCLWKPQEYLGAMVKMGPNRNITRDVVVVAGDTLKGQIHRVEKTLVDRLINEVEIKTLRASLDNQQSRDDARRYRNIDRLSAQVTALPAVSKAISTDLFGIFFEDINYAADGGLYGEMIQNRDFEYSSADHPREGEKWNATYAWSVSNGMDMAIESSSPIHENNAHYARLSSSATGAVLANSGWDGISVTKGDKYNFSIYSKADKSLPYEVRLVSKEGAVIASAKVALKATKTWKQSKAVLTAVADASGAHLELVSLSNGEVLVDMISLFPQKTYKNRSNGMRMDLAKTLEDMHPRFIRFPGGCVSHGNGIDNIYRWKNTIGELYERKSMANIWGYHQSVGLGFYEYFQFCEDLGAEPLPVLAAGVPCQNSAWGGAGQQGGIPLDKMDEYIQDILDLIEWANGDKGTTWGKKRAKAGHPAPFNLKYLGIGNEDLISEVFKERFEMIYKAVRAKYPDIQIVGTAGPFFEGSDYEYGWEFAKGLKVPLLDEHYYCAPGWFVNHQDFYDAYDRQGPKVYLGEYASHVDGRKSNMETALSVALYLTSVERNADVVSLSSYAPLFARRGRTQWTPDLIYFDSDSVYLTTDYYVQMLYGQNAGDKYVPNVTKLSSDREEVQKRFGTSIVTDSKTGDVIVKLVNFSPVPVDVDLNLTGLVEGAKQATVTTLEGVKARHHSDFRKNNRKGHMNGRHRAFSKKNRRQADDAHKSFKRENNKSDLYSAEKVNLEVDEVELSEQSQVEVAPYSFAVIRIKK